MATPEPENERQRAVVTGIETGIDRAAKTPGFLPPKMPTRDDKRIRQISTTAFRIVSAAVADHPQTPVSHVELLAEFATMALVAGRSSEQVQHAVYSLCGPFTD